MVIHILTMKLAGNKGEVFTLGMELKEDESGLD